MIDLLYSTVLVTVRSTVQCERSVSVNALTIERSAARCEAAVNSCSAVQQRTDRTEQNRRGEREKEREERENKWLQAKTYL